MGAQSPTLFRQDLLICKIWVGRTRHDRPRLTRPRQNINFITHAPSAPPSSAIPATDFGCPKYGLKLKHIPLSPLEYQNISRQLQLLFCDSYVIKHITSTHYCNISKIPKIPRAKYLKNCSMYKFYAKENYDTPKANGDAQKYQFYILINNFQDSRHIQDQKSLFETIFRPKSQYISLLLCTYISSLLK